MKKKPAKKRTLSKRYPKQQTMFYRYVSVGLTAFLLVIGARYLVSGATKVHVLGESTGPVLLADKGSDGTSGETSSGDGGSLNAGSSGTLTSTPSNTSGGSGGGDQTTTNTTTSLSGSSLVDCVGPDGKHFTTTYHACQELNQQWGHVNFTFTQLDGAKTGDSTTTSELHPTEAPDPTRDSHKTIDIQTQGDHGIFTVTQAATLNLKTEDGHLVVKAQDGTGQEVELNAKDAIEQINNELGSDGLEVSQSARSTITLKRAGVSAETAFPLSIDPITHILSITTPSGVKQVVVLPDQAVNEILQAKLMTSVQSESSTGSGVASQTATLTELNNQAVFEVNGVTQKKLLGLFPIGFAKTAFVSATSGQIVQMNESAFNKLLELFSF